MGVHVGCVITYPDEFHILNKDKFVCHVHWQPHGRLHDCGSGALALRKQNLPFGLYVTRLRVQEGWASFAGGNDRRTANPEVVTVNRCDSTTLPLHDRQTQLRIGKAWGRALLLLPTACRSSKAMGSHCLGRRSQQDTVSKQRHLPCREPITDALYSHCTGVASALILIALRFTCILQWKWTPRTRCCWTWLS